MEEYLKTGVFDDNIYDLLSLIIKSKTNALCIKSSNSRNQNLIKMIANKLVAEGQRIVMISEDEINQDSFEDVRAKDFVEIKEVDKRTGCKKLKRRFVKIGKLSPEMQFAFRGMNV
ncbi:TPA: hypothetical protein ACG3QY_001756 [Clostridioides difficile]